MHGGLIGTWHGKCLRSFLKVTGLTFPHSIRPIVTVEEPFPMWLALRACPHVSGWDHSPHSQSHVAHWKDSLNLFSWYCCYFDTLGSKELLSLFFLFPSLITCPIRNWSTETNCFCIYKKKAFIEMAVQTKHLLNCFKHGKQWATVCATPVQYSDT